MAQVYIADQGSPPAMPASREVRQPHGGVRDPHPACVDEPIYPGQHAKRKQYLHDGLKVSVKPYQPRNSKARPGEHGGGNQKCQHAEPDRCCAIKPADHNVVMAKSDQRSSHKAHREEPKNQWSPTTAPRAKRPCFVEDKMCKKEDRLHNCNERDQAFF